MRTSTISSLILILSFGCTGKGGITDTETDDTASGDTGVLSSEDVDDDGCQ